MKTSSNSSCKFFWGHPLIVSWQNAKKHFRVTLRLLRDIWSGDYSEFSKITDDNPVHFPVQFSLTQQLLPSSSLNEKIHNIELALPKINCCLIAPGKIFSFWHVVGEAASANGFKQARSIVGGAVISDYGGGLCQISCLLYHLSLKAGLPILERHPHSFDIYTEEQRFTPLGSDAAVAYGLKDLRIRNTFSFPIQFHFDIHSNTITASLCAPSSIEELGVLFERVEDLETRRKVITYISQKGARDHKAICISIYKVATSASNDSVN